MYVFTKNAIIIGVNVLILVILAFRPEAVGPLLTCQGSDVILKCQVQTSSPAVWWKNGRKVENSTKHTIMSNATTTNLVVHDVSEDEDNGAQFWCSDSNSKNSNSVALNVTGEDCVFRYNGQLTHNGIEFIIIRLISLVIETSLLNLWGLLMRIKCLDKQLSIIPAYVLANIMDCGCYKNTQNKE